MSKHTWNRLIARNAKRQSARTMQRRLDSTITKAELREARQIAITIFG
jgi:hypothetical protein